MNPTGETGQAAEHAGGRAGSRDFVSFIIAEQLFGVPVLQVQDVLSKQQITPVPLAASEIAGSLNLRGRVVTMIDMRRRLGLPPRGDGAHEMSIVVEHGPDLYSLIVDSVGEVLPLSSDSHEHNPPTLDPHLRDYSSGIYRLNDTLLVVLDVDKLLDYGRAAVA